MLLGLRGAGPEALFVGIMGGIIVMLTLFVFSSRVWMSDPGKRQP